MTAVYGCAGVKDKPGVSGSGGGGSTGHGGAGAIGGSNGGSGGMMPVSCNGPCTDFPTTPIVGMGADGSQGMYGSTSGPAPCVTEPEDNTLFPNNWLTPRVRVAGAPFLKITMHADKEANDLVAYAAGEFWVLPTDIWKNLAVHINDPDQVTVTVQTPGSAVTTVKFQIAPVGAGGSMVFWAADPSQAGKQGVEGMTQAQVVNDSWLDGFTVGDSSTLSQANGAPALVITDVQQPVAVQSGATQGSHCIGCHVGTPDGDYVAFVDAWPWGAAFAGVKETNKGQALTGYPGATCPDANHCTGGARSFVQYPWMGGFAFSGAHWSTGDRIGIVAAQIAPTDLFQPWSTDNKLVGNLVWIDTESTATTTNNGQIWPLRTMAFDYMQHTGDRGGVAFPTWSNDGNTVVYASSTGTTADQDGRLNLGATDLYAVPYNARAGGAATAVPGASDPGFEEYYPAFSPDDRMIAFTRVPAGQVMYANPNAEVLVVPYGSSGAQAIPLAANQPPSCSGKSSPGINNHWARWSPDVSPANGKLYYWLIFSSNRYGLPTVTTNFNGTTKVVEISQLYMTAVVVNETSVSTYPAVYLWNQPQNRVNTTPAWQNFNIPLIVQ